MCISYRWIERLRIVCTCMLLLPVMAVSGDADNDLPWTDDLQIHGFISQGFIKTSDNRFFGPSDNGSWDFREIGLNASYRMRSDLLFSSQLLSRKAGEMYDGSLRLDYGLMDYAFIMRGAFQAGVRLGRIKIPLGFYNDTRDVPFTRPSIFLPQSIYFDRVRNLSLSSDGGGIYGNVLNDWGDFYLQMNVGRLDVDTNVEYAFLLTDWPGKLKTDDPWVTGRLAYEWDGGRVRLAASGATGALNYKPGSNDFLQAGTVDIDFWILSAQYNEESWSLTAEYMNEPVSWSHFGPFGGLTNGTAEGWYVQGAYRPFVDWEILLRYDESYLNKDDRDGTNAGRVLNVPPYNFYAKDLTFGVRWDVTSSFMLRAEYHRVEGTSWLSVRENDPGSMEKNWDMFSILASYRF